MLKLPKTFRRPHLLKANNMPVLCCAECIPARSIKGFLLCGNKIDWFVWVAKGGCGMRRTCESRRAAPLGLPKSRPTTLITPFKGCMRHAPIQHSALQLFLLFPEPSNKIQLAALLAMGISTKALQIRLKQRAKSLCFFFCFRLGVPSVFFLRLPEAKFIYLLARWGF